MFNTAITRAQSLVVSIGNPFMLLKIERYMEQKYGFKARCWREYLKRCIECKTFIVPVAQRSGNEKILDAEKQLQSMLFTDMAISSGIVPLPHDHDSILAAYAKVFNNTPECHQAQLIISRINKCISWSLSNKESSLTVVRQGDDWSQNLFSAQYECLLSCSRYDKADAIPLDPNNHMVKILGANNRRGAFDGDTVLVGVFDNNSLERKGRVIKCIVHHSTSDSLKFACHVDSINPILFVPLNNKDPKLLNLPKLSQDLLKRKSQLGLDKEIKATEVIVFKDTWDGIGLPQISDAIPFHIAQKMLFVVRFLCWNPKYRLPLGIVVAAIPQGLSFFHAQRLLKVEHGVPDLEVTKSFVPCNSIPINPAMTLNKRAFTIDPEGAQNLDDAISLVLVESTGSSCVYKMAVHIANVAKNVKRGSDEDKRAHKAGSSVYGTKGSGCAHLLHSDMRSKLSLSPMKVRDVISVVCTVTFENTHEPQLSEPVIKESQIVSQLQLTYQEANNLLQGTIPSSSSPIESFDSSEPFQPSLINSLRILYKIAFQQRQKRLGTTAAFNYSISEDGEENCWKAHLMVEELMIWGNHVIAKTIYNAFSNCALLRRQRSPNNEERAACLGLHSLILPHSLSLRPPISQPGTAIPIRLPQFMIERLIEAVKNSDASLLTYLLTADHYYPQLAVCQAQLQSINHKAEYCCPAGENDSAAIAHYSLHLNLYTHFTSPIRRYMDIEVQRMLICMLRACDKGEITAQDNDEFTVQMCKDLCNELNSRSRAAKSFENGLKRVSLALELAAQSTECFAFIKKLDKSSIDLYFSDLVYKVLSPKQKSIKLKSLGFLDNNTSNLYRWKIKILSFCDNISLWGFTSEDMPEGKSHGVCKIEVLESTEDNHYKAVDLGVNLKQFVRNVDAIMWKELQSEACKEAAMGMKEIRSGPSKAAVAPIECQSSNLIEVTRTFLQKMSLQDTSTEQDPFITSSPIVNYSLLLNIDLYDLLKVWMSWECKDELIAPCIQMVQLAPNAHICIQHNSSPAECFSDASLPQASKSQYNSISEYVKLWEPLVLAEGAEISVKQGQIIIIQNVILNWPELAIPLDSIDDFYYEPKGPIIVEIPHHFQHTSAVFLDTIRIGDMMCVRYGTFPGSNVKAVFHMVVTKLITDIDGITLSSIEMIIFGKQNCRISKEVKTTLTSKCELQLIRMATSIQ